MDQHKRTQLIEQLRTVGLPSHDAPSPVVSLEAFFDGNDDVGSLGCNLTDHPGMERFHSVLQQIRNRSDVYDVLIEVSEVEEADDDMWPFSEQLFVISTADPAAVASLLDELQPTEITDDTPLPPSAPAVPAGFTIYSAWWD